MDFKISISPEDRTEKVRNFQRESSLINEKSTREISQLEMKELVVAPHSRTWSNIVFNGKRKAENFKSLQVIALDFDNKPTDEKEPLFPADVVERAKKEGFDVSFIYSTFSHKNECPRYRAVWVLDSEVTNAKEAKRFIKIIYNLYPEADKVTDLARMWLGGLDIIYNTDDYVLPVEKIIELGYFYKIGSGSNKARNGREYLKKNSTSYYYSSKDVEKSSFMPQHEIRDKLRNYDYAYACEYSGLLNDFINADKKIWHNHLLFLASNLFMIEGGMKMFKKQIEKNKYICNSKINIMNYVKQRWELKNPIYPISFGALDNSHEDNKLKSKYRNLLYIRPHTQYDKAILVEELKTQYSLEEARKTLKKEFEKAMDSDDNSIYIFKCATGLGKSSLAINEKNVVLLFPSHDLKKEQASNSLINPRCTPNIADFDIPVDIMEQYQNWCRVGQYKYANHIIKDYMETHTTTIKRLSYLMDKKLCDSSEDTIFSTHHKGIHLDYSNKDTYIFDEDPIGTLFQSNKCSTKDLRIVASILQEKGNPIDANTLSSVVKQIDLGISNFSNNKLTLVFDNNDSVESAIIEYHKTHKSTNNVFGLLFANNPFFVIKPEEEKDPTGDKVIYYIDYKPFNENKKYIILSATANEKIYKKLYGDRVKVIDISNVEQRGQVIQFSNMSFARRSMRRQKGGKRMSIAKSFMPNLPVISTKNNKEVFTSNNNFLYFGNCSGTNIFTGMDLKVVGTPHCHPIAIELMSKILEVRTSSKDFDFRKQKIKYNGFEFTFVTSDNLDIREIQFYYIERELVQAIGRARLLDNDCTVYLFSDYPIPRAKQYKLNETVIFEDSKKAA